MKRTLTSLCLGAAALLLAGCIDPGMLDPGFGPAGYGPRPPSYGGGYGGGYSSCYDYDHHHHTSSSSSRDSNYYGGPRAWYQAGEGIGKRDRREHHSPDYRRHKSQYDGRTESEFARGYHDGYYGR